MSLSCVWPEAHAVAESCLRRASTKRLQFAKVIIIGEIRKRCSAFVMERNGGGGELRVERFPAAAAGYMSGRASEEPFGGFDTVPNQNVQI